MGRIASFLAATLALGWFASLGLGQTPTDQPQTVNVKGDAELSGLIKKRPTVRVLKCRELTEAGLKSLKALSQLEQLNLFMCFTAH